MTGDDRHSLSITDEDYLAALFGLEEDGVPLIQARLAERLGVSAAAVSDAVPRLVKRRLLEQQTDRSLQLSADGRRVADAVVRRHRLAERLLVDVLGLAWEKVHHEAARWEHVISEDVEEHLVAVLGDPATCPHGNRIPGTRQEVREADPLPLSSAGRGARVTVARISEHLQVDDAALALLAQSRLIPGCPATVVDASSGAVVVRTPRGEHMIPSAVGAHVWVTRD